MANGKEARNGEERGETANEQQSPPRRRKIDEKEGWLGWLGWVEGLLGLACCCCCLSERRVSEAALRDLQPTGETRANKSPQLPPVRAICLDGRLMPDIIHPGNNTLLSNEV